jgi:hypothetical protein
LKRRRRKTNAFSILVSSSAVTLPCCITLVTILILVPAGAAPM